ncbi:ABC transporter ATP-binding protein [Leifsonia sp. ALI-44-B]|uniref:ABC transporter ATP-binding protein n=1 Tax=Leifsonia sp. ALI-44-B TaxID=1933776 RepID=UPI0009F938E8|nr:ABC transporter ATP-binding protein [Leifsonia sp. ALI-44-B]
MTDASIPAPEAPQTPEPRLVVDGLRIRHDGRDRFSPDGVTFTLRAGEVVLLMGPSGSGKSTLALALNGLVPHAVPAEMHGSVRVDGVDTTDASVAALSERVGMVFQDADAQIVTGSVLDEVCFGPENLSLPVPEILRRAEAALRRVGLWERRDDNPDILSGGGRQRVAIAAALALDSDTIVLDEPTANLDAAGADDVYDALAEIASDGRHTLVLIEHDLDRAVRIVDRVIVIDRDGHPVADGTPREVLAGRADELHRLGVWLPPATEAGRRLRRAGVFDAGEPLPLTGEELTAALDAVPRERALSSLPAPRATAAAASTAASASAPPSTSASAPASASTSARAAPAATKAAPEHPQPAVVLDRVSVTRRRTRIVHDVSLTIGRGEFWAIVGVNGAGKSSLVQTMVGITAPSSGRVRVHGFDPARTDARRLSEHVGFVFQNPEHQFVAHTAFDELAYGLRARRVDESTIEHQVTGMLERFGLADAAHVHPFLLSGGQKRRLSVGTALIAGASTLVLDEPTFGQDRERSDELLDLLQSLNRAGTTVVVVTHDLQLAVDHADHLAVMADGRLVESGTVDEILGDEAILERNGLRMPPLARAFQEVTTHPEWRQVRRLDQIAGAAAHVGGDHGTSGRRADA